MLWLSILWGQVALAEPVVLHRADEAAVRASISDVANIDPVTLSVTHFDAFRASMAPQWSGKGGLTPCGSSPVQLETVSESVASAESSLMYMKLDVASEALAQAHQSLVCLDERIDAQVAARIGFLQGVIATENKDQAKAWEHFSHAVRFDPDLQWDEQYPIDGKDVLEGARSVLVSASTIEIEITPSLPSAEAEDARLFFNAVPVTTSGPLQASVGSHVLQVNGPQGVVGYRLEVEPESRPKVFLPELIRADALAQVTTDEGKQELSRIINASYESGTPVYVAHGDGIWRTASGIGSWETLQFSAGTVRGRAGVRPMAWVASGLTVGALTGTVLSLVKALQSGANIETASNNFQQAASEGDFAGAKSAYTRELDHRSARTTGFVGAGLGAALTATGVIFTVPMF